MPGYDKDDFETEIPKGPMFVVDPNTAENFLNEFGPLLQQFRTLRRKLESAQATVRGEDVILPENNKVDTALRTTQ